MRRDVVAGPFGTLCFWLQLVEMFSTCFPMFTELRARNAACGCGSWPAGAWPPGSGRVSTSAAVPGPMPATGTLRAAREGRVGEQRPRSSGHASRRPGSQGLGELCGQGIRGCPLTPGAGGGFPGPVPLELGPPAEQHEASLPQQRFCCRAGRGSGSRATQGSGAGLTSWPGRPG